MEKQKSYYFFVPQNDNLENKEIKELQKTKSSNLCKVLTLKFTKKNNSIGKLYRGVSFVDIYEKNKRIDVTAKFKNFKIIDHLIRKSNKSSIGGFCFFSNTNTLIRGYFRHFKNLSSSNTINPIALIFNLFFFLKKLQIGESLAKIENINTYVTTLLSFNLNKNINNTLFLKNSINSFFNDISQTFYRTSLNYFDYFKYMSYHFEFKLNNSTFYDLHELSVWVGAIPVFFSKNLLKVIIGVEPEFGIFPKITEMLELVLSSMYAKYLYT